MFILLLIGTLGFSSACSSKKLNEPLDLQVSIYNIAEIQPKLAIGTDPSLSSDKEGVKEKLKSILTPLIASAIKNTTKLKVVKADISILSLDSQPMECTSLFRTEDLPPSQPTSFTCVLGENGNITNVCTGTSFCNPMDIKGVPIDNMKMIATFRIKDPWKRPLIVLLTQLPKFIEFEKDLRKKVQRAFASSTIGVNVRRRNDGDEEDDEP